MGWLSALLGLGGKALEKILPDRARLQQQQMEINAETERTSGGRMTPRKLLMYLLAVAAGWELLLRPVIATYWPAALQPGRCSASKRPPGLSRAGASRPTATASA